jgi:hypothetical protein
MVRLIVTFLNLLVILVLQIFPGDVSVKLEAPGEVQAGSEFEIKVTLNKGDLEGFSRFQQSIPAGLTATPVASSNADFSFTEKRVRLIWLRIPENDEITVSYRIKVDERLKGTFSLAGKFSYIENNERKSVDIEPVAININPSSTIDPSLIVDINDFEQATMPFPGLPAEAASVACIRQKPYAGAQGDYVVNVLVRKNLTRQFAKIEEIVPEGYTAVALDPKDAIFTFKDQKVKFLWMTLPTERFFTVSYRLIPKNQAKLQPPAINGAFSYLVEEKSVSVDILEREFNLAEINNDNIDEMLTGIIEQPSTQIAQVTTQEQPVIESPVIESETPAVVTQPDTPKQNKAEVKSQSRPVKKPVVKKQPQSVLTADASVMLDPQDGVYYRIQLAAGHKAVNIKRYFNKMNLEKEVRWEAHDGWNKYSIGSFNMYREARDYRVHIWNTTPVKDAFITAYNSGKRITVQEALMITEQKWYR